ncbi:MAG TPA: CCA tRNA nucleotidyltransferase [Planctomycetota bacterium]|mgnify:CR=1 FL=1|nr:CCA tRNA nucleotidyltransferase [Planctomycetota bacterium]HRR79166.1 CCA tRNA nucleotidyltransferase [Planctomycetota bacterium]HRT93965.1 CCA tRNA nucleotidyltransferase [Planctomycetota bacterium]
MSAPLRQKADRIVRRLADAGHQALFAGGCVRDMLRGEEPHDYDIATDATPARVQALFERTVPVGAQFGVVVVVDGEDQFEVAQFRADLGYSDGRRPDAVRPAAAREDALRRDFTINGLFYDPLKDEVLDFVGGRRDLAEGVVRAIGDPDARFREDSLRLLRAVRFTARYAYRLDEATAAAVRRHAGEIRRVSAERIGEELTRILTGPNRGAALELLQATGLLAHVLPEVEAMVGCQQPPEFHPEGDVFAHTRLCLDALENPSLTLAFATLLHDVGKPVTQVESDRIRFNLHDKAGAQMTREICERLRFPAEQTEAIAALVLDHMRFMAVRDMRPSTLKRFLRSPHFAEGLELHRADCVASHGSLKNYEFCKEKLASLPEDVIRPPRLVTGHDLIALGYRPGPPFAAMLARVEDAQLEGEIATRDEALELVRREFPLTGADGERS